MCRWTAVLSLALMATTAGIDAAYAGVGQKVVVILDNSGSMNTPIQGAGQRGLRIDAAKQALLKVLDRTDSEAEIGVILLNGDARGQWLIPLGSVDKPSMQRAISRISADGPTPLGETLKVASNALLERRADERYGTYKLLVVSDGEATDAQLVEEYLPEILARGVQVEVIGVAMSTAHSLAKRANTYRRADDSASLEKAISEVVLGESSGDSGDAGDSDFELLAPLPVEIATVSLKALASPSNQPIGEAAANEGAVGDPWQPNQTVNPPHAGPPVAENNGRSPIKLLVIGGIILLVVIKVISSIGRSR